MSPFVIESDLITAVNGADFAGTTATAAPPVGAAVVVALVVPATGFASTTADCRLKRPFASRLIAMTGALSATLSATNARVPRSKLAPSNAMPSAASNDALSSARLVRRCWTCTRASSTSPASAGPDASRR